MSFFYLDRRGGNGGPTTWARQFGPYFFFCGLCLCLYVWLLQFFVAPK